MYNDGRPFQIARLAPDLSVQEQFSQLAQERKSVVAANQPYNFLWCGASAAFYVISIQYDKGLVSFVDIPAQLSVDQFADGINTIAEASLYGGPMFVNSLLERILNVRLNRYSVFTKDNVVKAATIIGGVTVSLDEKSAARLGKSAGNQKLASNELVSYLSREGTDAQSHTQRELAVLRAIFEGLKNKGIVLTSTSSQQILSLIESNFTAAEVMDLYIRFSSGGLNWKSKEMRLPVEETRTRGRLQYLPVLDKCQALLGNSL
jgi:anionic cell wall polymer biosynthesis LytR-Cps2A-Psr (LCP) family protein